MTEQPHPPRRVAVALAAVPHVLVLAWMALTLATSDDSGRAYAGFLGVVELVVMPVALLAALAAYLIRPLRHWALPIAGVTVAGGLLVILVAIVVAGVTGT